MCVLHNKRSHCNEKPAYHSLQLEKACAKAMKTQCSQKLKKKKKKKEAFYKYRINT